MKARKKRMVPIIVEYQGEEFTIRALSKKTGVKYQTIIGRYHRGKKGNELITPGVRTRTPKRYNYKGKPLTMQEIADIAGKSIFTVRSSFYRYGSFKYINRPDQKTAKARVLCTIDGEKYKASDLTRLFGISRQAVSIQYLKKDPKEFKEWVIRKMASQNAHARKNAKGKGKG